MADFPIYRLVKGNTLTFTEMDDNLRWLSRNMSGSTVTITGSVIGMSGSVNIIGNVQIAGTASIGFIKSEGYSTGSNQLGDDTLDTQTLIGIVSVSGSMSVSGSTVINNLTGSLFGTSSWARNATTASYALNAVSASFASTASYVNPLNQQVIITGSLIQGLGGNIATGEYSHAEGSITKAIGDYSHAEGDNTQAKGNYSHTEGQETIASGSYSHAEGYNTISSGSYSHAEGESTVASGIGAHAEGFYTVASGDYQHVQGQFNISSSDVGAFIIGNGDVYNRSNLVFASGSQFQITGSLKVLGSITGSLFGTASNAVSSSYALSASYAVSSSYAYTASSAISAYTASSSVSSSYAITASHAESLKIGLNLSASSINITNNIVANSITAQSASFGYVQTITGSAVIIGEEFIILNTQTPTARYAGLIIYDSGSSTTTASLVWDSQTNHFVYSNNSGSSYSGGGFIAGPKNSGSLADVTYPTLNRVVRGQGDDHIYDSNIIDNDIKVSISIPLAVTGSITATQGFTGSLFGTASSAVSSSYAYTASSAINSFYAYTASSAVSSSYAYTASSAISASLSISSSYVSGSAAIVTNLTSSNDALINGIPIGKGLGSVATNIAIGQGALANFVAGTNSNNTAIGNNAMFSASSGNYNTAVGSGALVRNGTGFQNTAIGSFAMFTNGSGSYNTAVGYSAMQLSTGSFNTAIGNLAMPQNTGSNNTVIGYQAMLNGRSSTDNVAIGQNSLGNARIANYNVSIGSLSLYNASGTGFGTSSYNIAIGYEAARRTQGAFLYSASYGIFIGTDVRPLQDVSNNEIVIGYQAIGSGSNTVSIGNSSITITQLQGSVRTTGAFTGSLFGTSSWSENTISSSYDYTASSAVNSSNALTLNQTSSNGFVSNMSDTYTGTAKITDIITLSSAEYAAIGAPLTSTLYIII